MQSRFVAGVLIGILIGIGGAIVFTPSRAFARPTLVDHRYKVAENYAGSAAQVTQLLNESAAGGWHFVGSQGGMLIFEK
jgi:hypothetical protein